MGEVYKNNKVINWKNYCRVDNVDCNNDVFLNIALAGICKNQINQINQINQKALCVNLKQICYKPLVVFTQSTDFDGMCLCQTIYRNKG